MFALSSRSTALLVAVLALGLSAGCGSSHALNPDAGTDGGADAGPPGTPVVISTGNRTPRTTTWSVNYWTWMPDYSDSVAGTETLVNALKPTIMRVGGYNNDANYSRSLRRRRVRHGRHLCARHRRRAADPGAASGRHQRTAAHRRKPAPTMVTYANITKGYGIKYFSVGNEPDIYAVAGSADRHPTQPAIPGYTPADFCASAHRLRRRR